MSARFRLPAGRSYNVRATELERDRQHTQVVCNVLLLDNSVQAFRVSVSSADIQTSFCGQNQEMLGLQRNFENQEAPWAVDGR
uniref:Uncharacterized protein n=1 Tax=Oryzias sinensis TaxID=183150 RepID=A0A8C7X5Y4_9TELE